MKTWGISLESGHETAVAPHLDAPLSRVGLTRMGYIIYTYNHIYIYTHTPTVGNDHITIYRNWMDWHIRYVLISDMGLMIVLHLPCLTPMLKHSTMSSIGSWWIVSDDTFLQHCPMYLVASNTWCSHIFFSITHIVPLLWCVGTNVIL